MRTKIHWIKQFENGGRIGIMARPRGGDWLEEEIAHLKKQQVNVLVSLLEKEEIAELDLKNAPACCLANNIELIHFPLPDRTVPKNERAVLELRSALKEKIESGSSVIVHCRMGIGRSSIIAAAVLLAKGYKAMDLIQEISRIRGLQVPDTKEQVDWLVQLERKNL